MQLYFIPSPPPIPHTPTHITNNFKFKALGTAVGGTDNKRCVCVYIFITPHPFIYPPSPPSQKVMGPRLNLVL